ncbi:uncharacterized protein LOC122524523 [Polistes fuscatus]|uniref:uncharacterized protein LOC122524523 n=1 Tax=Polistes fuscatus TaxID=30207 RepID=UPI001CA9D09D|nr:uncharacterized protein LOC122524523 [Polistes fuscatus]
MANVKNVALFSDSTTVLAWIKSHPRRWSTFVGNRITHIRELCPSATWRYISKQNPTDLASRGCLASQLISHSLWWKGPLNLSSQLSKLSNPDIELVTHEKERSLKALAIQKSENFWISIMERMSKYNRLVWTLAYIIRYCHKVRHQLVIHDSSLSSNDIQKAVSFIVRTVQEYHFSDEITKLRSNKQLQRGSPIHNLSPYLDSEGLLRVGRRMHNTSLNQFNPHPLLLPNCHFSHLLLKKIHTDSFHGGTKLMCAHARRLYWIIGLQRTAKGIVQRCVRCARYRAETFSPSIGNLPSERVTPSKPFLVTGIDFAGPVFLRPYETRGNLTTKGYIAVFVCFSTKAIHLELVMSISVDSLMMSLQRLISRRGRVETFYSDNGRNFVILPYLPQFRGLWEAGVKSANGHLSRTFNGQTLTIEKYQTALCQIKNILDSRPLTPLSFSEPYILISPYHLLLGETISAFPNVPLASDHTKLRYQHLQNITSGFWRRW